MTELSQGGHSTRKRGKTYVVGILSRLLRVENLVAIHAERLSTHGDWLNKLDQRLAAIETVEAIEVVEYLDLDPTDDGPTPA